MKRGILLVPTLALLAAGCGSSLASPPASPTAALGTLPTSTAVTKDPKPKPTAHATATPARIRIPQKGSAFDKGTAYQRAGLYDAAVQQFWLSINRHQHVADSYADLGTIALAQQNYPDAYLRFQAAVRLQPKNTGYLYYTAFAAIHAQDFTDAIFYATRYIRLEPKNPAGYYLRFQAYGDLLNRSGQVHDAMMLAQLQPKSAEAFNDLGLALTNAGKFPQAIQAFTRAVQLDPRTGLYYINRAQAEGFNNRPKLALQDLETARSLARDAQSREQVDRVILMLCQTSQPGVAKACLGAQRPAHQS